MRLVVATSTVALAALTAALPQPVGQGAGLVIPITKRSNLVNSDGTVSIGAIKSHVASLQSKVARAFGNFEQNIGARHPSALEGIQRRGSGAVPLTDDNSQMWYGSISVGAPANDFTVDFDMGSSDLFLPGPKCDSTCNGHTIFDPSASSTSSDLGKTFSHEFADKSTVSGEQYSDTVSIAGLSATDQTLGVASHYSSDWAIDKFPSDGLMGMGFESISNYQASPVFQSLVSQGQVDQAVFVRIYDSAF